jgi:hypothetical protein
MGSFFIKIPNYYGFRIVKIGFTAIFQTRRLLLVSCGDAGCQPECLRFIVDGREEH